VAGAPFDPGPSAFEGLFDRRNGLRAAGFVAWEFLPGMRFGERAAWWRGGTDRGAPHAGLDLCRYRTADGASASLRPGARIPSLWPGEVVAVVQDFLGSSVFVAHPLRDEAGRRLHSVYGHVRPAAGIAPGTLLGEGGEVGLIADPPADRAVVPAHLHLSVALIAPEAGGGRLDWTALQETSRVHLLDPLPFALGASH